MEADDDFIDDGSAHLAQLADAAEEADDAEGAHEADEPGGDRAVGQVQDRHAHHHHVQPVLAAPAWRAVGDGLRAHTNREV